MSDSSTSTPLSSDKEFTVDDGAAMVLLFGIAALSPLSPGKSHDCNRGMFSAQRSIDACGTQKGCIDIPGTIYSKLQCTEA